MKCDKSCCHYPCNRKECDNGECEEYKSIIQEAQEIIDSSVEN